MHFSSPRRLPLTYPRRLYRLYHLYQITGGLAAAVLLYCVVGVAALHIQGKAAVEEVASEPKTGASGRVCLAVSGVE